MPRKNGFLNIGYFSAREFIGFTSTVITPEGYLTAVATFLGPRILTPSITACPPTINFSDT